MVLDRLAKVGKVGLGVFLLGSAFFLIAFSTPYWGSYPHHHFGLWEYCNSYSCAKTVSTRVDHTFDADWFRGTQALACLALIALIFDFVVRIMFLCGKHSKFLVLSVLLDCLTAVFAFLAAVVFGSEIDRSRVYAFKWGFVFDIVSGVIFVGAAVCFLIEYCRHR